MMKRYVWLLLCACGGSALPVPCMSDNECRGDRICHQGRCLFEEEARAQLTSPTPIPQEPTPTPIPAASGTDAATFMGGPQRSGRSRSHGPASTPRAVWRHRTEGRVFASPIVGPDGTIYVGSLDRTFAA